MAIGIDVSYAQLKPDWARVKSTKVIDFVYAKATGGLAARGPDVTFEHNWTELKRVGIPRGAYHFFQATADPIAQADVFFKTVGRLDNDDLPPMLDVEVERPKNMTGAQFARNTRTCIERIESLFGRRVVLYTGGPIFEHEMLGASQEDLQFFSERYLWLAAYVEDPERYVPRAWKSAGKSWTIWQLSGDKDAQGNKGFTLPGIATVVDKDVTQGLADDITKFIVDSMIERATQPDAHLIPIEIDTTHVEPQDERDEPLVVPGPSGLWGIIMLLFKFVCGLFGRN